MDSGPSAKYEVRRTFPMYEVWYGVGYPYSNLIRSACLTMRTAKRAIRRHRAKVARGKAAASNHNPHGILYTEYE